MKDDELPGEADHVASRRYRGRTERFINSSQVGDLEQAEDLARAQAAEEDRLLRDEEEAKSELPR